MGELLLSKKNPDFEVIVPVLNEQDSISELVTRTDKALKAAGINYGLIFVDDNSTDGTARRIKSLQKKFPITLLTKKGKPGKAYSILEAAEVASADVLAMIDGDLQYPPEALPAMFELSKKYGVVVANRRKDGVSVIRKIGSNLAARIVAKLLLNLDCDAQSGLKVFKREIIKNVSEVDVKAWALDMPLLQTAREMGEEIGTVEIDFSERKKGSSKVSFIKTAYQITATAVKLKMRGRRTHFLPPSDDHPLRGAGVAHKDKKYITHTTLPHYNSALVTLSGWQKLFVASAALAFGIGLFVDLMATLTLLVAVLSTIYFADVVFTAWILAKSLHFPPELKFNQTELDLIDESKLPVYSVLCPLYKEGHVLGEFVKSIKKLDWPKEKLDVLMLLEAGDVETLEASRKIKLPDYFRVVVVPDSRPKTKPKACNYGLTMAKGEYVVVYDAEDRPDPLQLKKAYLGFEKLGKKVFCLQSKLNYYNPNHNLLTRLFTAEYSLWFDVVLPGLQSIEASMPLGGTSNHFRTQDLINIHAWDPFNVTEDCDLGVRIFKSGGKTAIIDSTTYEEANSSVGNWIRQRSRWIKGYIQTYLVHMRDPIRFVRTHGVHALIFQLVIGMRVSFMLINPFLWVMTIAYFLFRSTAGVVIEALYPAPVFYMAVFALVVGNFMYIYNYMIGCAKRGQWNLIKYVLVIPAYWVLASVAAFKAVKQLAFKPHFWEKTTHGLHLSKVRSVQEYKARQPKSFFGKLPAGLFLISATLISNFTDFVTSTYLGRSLPAEEFGLISLMTSFLFVIQLPVAGVTQTVSSKTAFLLGKYGSPSGKLWSAYQKGLLKVSLFMAIVWAISSPFLATFFNSNTILPFVLFSPLWIVMIVGAVSTGFLEGSLNFKKLATVMVVGAAAKLFFSILFVELGWRDFVYAALPLAFMTGISVAWIFSKQVSDKLAKTQASRAHIERNLRFPGRFFAASILINVSAISFMSMDLLFVKHFLPAAEAGRYALLVLVGRIIYVAGSLFSQFILPFASKDEGMGTDSHKAFTKLLAAVIISTSFAFILVGPLGLYTIPLVFGEKALPIVPYLKPFAFSMVLFSVAYSLVVFHQARKEYWFAVIGIITSILQAVGLFLFHDSVLSVVKIMIVCGAFFLAGSLGLHIFYRQFIFLLSNIRDFFGLFLLKLNGKRPLVNGHLRILIYNWRDTRHVWAGGAEVYVHELAKRWVADGNEVTLFCGNDGRSKREEEIDGVKIIRRGGFYTVYVWAFLYYLIHFRRRYDVIVESENGVPFFTPLYSTKPKVLVVHHVHREVFREHLRFPLSLIAEFVESKIMPFVYRGETIVAISDSTKKDILKTKIASEEDIYVVSPGISNQLFHRSRKTKEPSFIFLGRLKAYKNIDVAIRAFSKVLKSFPNAKLTIAGDGEQAAALRGLVDKLGIKQAVIFTGKVTEEEKVRLLGRSWAALQPSSFEGWGITVIEANACGTPVIASRVNGLCDSVVDGKTGILVPVKNVDLLKKAMVRIVKDKKTRQQMSNNAFEWARNHNWQDRAFDFMKVINTVVERKGAKSPAGELAPNANYLYEEE